MLGPGYSLGEGAQTMPRDILEAAVPLVGLAACSGGPTILPFAAGSVGPWNREGESPGLAFLV